MNFEFKKYLYGHEELKLTDKKEMKEFIKSLNFPEEINTSAFDILNNYDIYELYYYFNYENLNLKILLELKFHLIWALTKIPDGIFINTHIPGKAPQQMDFLNGH